MNRRKVLHIITGLSTGGAEMMLLKLLTHTDPQAFESRVISLTGDGRLAEPLRRAGIDVRSLGLRPALPNLLRLGRLTEWIREFLPDVVQTWMPHANLWGGWAARRAGAPRLLWGLHMSHLGPEVNKRSLLWIIALCARLSLRWPQGIVCCSEACRRAHARAGYDTDRMTVIPIGIDVDSFRPDAGARASLAGELGIGPDDLWVGHIARFDAHKDQRNFLQAAGRLAERLPRARFLMCGDGIQKSNRRLMTWIREAGVEDRCRLLGLRNDVASLAAALDVAVSSSRGEGFPTAVGEAMACGAPCVVTDVGDSAFMVKDTGRVVPPGDPGALARAVEEVLTLPVGERRALGAAARRRVEQTFGLPSVVARYAALYQLNKGAVEATSLEK